MQVGVFLVSKYKKNRFVTIGNRDALSRLENFKECEGNILYVNPSDFDATDSFENRGNSLTRPFKTIQRQLSSPQGSRSERVEITIRLILQQSSSILEPTILIIDQVIRSRITAEPLKSRNLLTRSGPQLVHL